MQRNLTQPMQQVEKFSERRVICQEDTPEGSTVLPSSLSVCSPVALSLGPSLIWELQGIFVIFPFFVVIHSSPTISQYDD